MSSSFDPVHRPLPALIGLAFADIAEGLMTQVSAAGHPDLRLHHLLNVFRFLPPEGERPARLARRAGVTAQAMSATLAELERSGYVVREPDPADGRSSIVRWSDRGYEAGMVAERWFLELERRWSTLVGEQALVDARATLAAIVSAGTP